ncbi:MAG: DNA adenine methylase [Deltaproteobacteria bacterium]|nr:MAG: DNA adenine methylase [Deltaproteobacteria bacterium]
MTPFILNTIADFFPNATSVMDLFSGSSCVGYALKKKGYQVFSNDHNFFAYMLAKCYVETDFSYELIKDTSLWIAYLNTLHGSSGYFTSTFCVKSNFFHKSNGEKIDSIREEILHHSLPPALTAILLVSLIEAADKVDSTCGMQMAYLKKFPPRAYKPITLKVPTLLYQSTYGKSLALNLDVLSAAKKIIADVAYIDPPYNQHNYLANYHIWESLALWDKPAHYGIACKRIDCKVRKSIFNYKNLFLSNLSHLLNIIQSKNIILSFSDEGFINSNELKQFLSKHGKLISILSFKYKRYIGSKIGIHNKFGIPVGHSSHSYNKEFLYILEK